MIPPSIGLTAMGFADDLHAAADKIEDEYPRLAYALRKKSLQIQDGDIQIVKPGEQCPACATIITATRCVECDHIF